MALNFGLGFIFGAKDNGLGRALSNLSSQFKSFGKEMLSLQRFQTMLSAMSFDRLDDLSGKLKQLGTGGLELTSSMEGTFAGFDKDLRKFGVSVGKTGANLTKFKAAAASMAYGLNMGADEAGKAIYGFEASVGKMKAADVLKAMEVDSKSTFAKFASVTGKSADEFGYTVSRIANSAGFSAKSMGELTNMLIKFDQTTGNTNFDSLGKLDEIGKLLKKQKELGATSAQLEAFGKGIVAVADSFYAITGNGPRAMEVATGLAEALTENKKGFKDLAAGAAQALPDFMQKFGMAGTGIDEAFASMSESPDEFLKKFATAVQGLENPKQIEAAMEFFRAHASSAFGDVGDDIVTMLQKPEGRVKLMGMNVSELVKNSAGAAGKIAKEGYSTGLTAAQVFERQQEAFLQRIRNLTTISTKQFLSETRKSFDGFAKMLERTAANDGPMGMVVRKLADIQKFGATALFPPNMQGPLVVLGEAAEKLISPLAKLRAAGLDLTSPFGALAGVVGLLGAKFFANRMTAAEEMEKSLKDSKKYSKKQIEQIMSTNAISEYLNNTALKDTAQNTIDFFKNTLPQYASKAINFISSFARKVLTGGFSKGFDNITGDKETDKVLNELMTVLEDAFNSAAAYAKDLFGGLWDGLLGKSVDANTANDATVIGAALGQTVHKAFDFVVDEVSKWLNGWWARVTTIWGDESKTLEQKVKEIFGESIPLVIAGALLSGTAIGQLAAGLSGMFLSAIFKISWGVLSAVFGDILWGMLLKPALTTALAPAAEWLGTALLGLLSGAKAKLMSFFVSIASTIWSFLSGTLWPIIQSAVSAVIGAITAPIAIAIAVISAFFVGMFFMFQEEGDEFSDSWDRMWMGIFTTVEWYMDEIWASLKWVTANSVIAFTNLTLSVYNVFADLWDDLKTGGAQLYNFFARAFNKLIKALSSPIQKMLQTVGSFMEQIVNLVASSPTLASVFGVTPEALKGLKDMSKSLKEATKQETADFFSVEEMAVPIKGGLRGSKIDYVDKEAVESLGARQARESEMIDFNKEQRQKQQKAEKAKAEAAVKSAAPTVTPAAMPAAAVAAPLPSAVASAPSTVEQPKIAAPVTSGALEKEGQWSLLSTATNNPAWVSDYFVILKEQNSLLKQISERISSPSATPGAASASRAPRSTMPGASTTAPPPLNPGRR